MVDSVQSLPSVQGNNLIVDISVWGVLSGKFGETTLLSIECRRFKSISGSIIRTRSLGLIVRREGYKYLSLWGDFVSARVFGENFRLGLVSLVIFRVFLKDFFKINYFKFLMNKGGSVVSKTCDAIIQRNSNLSWYQHSHLSSYQHSHISWYKHNKGNT